MLFTWPISNNLDTMPLANCHEPQLLSQSPEQFQTIPAEKPVPSATAFSNAYFVSNACWWGEAELLSQNN